MKNKVLFLVFSLSTFLSFSQYIEGKVLDIKTNNPIEGVHVYMKGINTYNIQTKELKEYLIDLSLKSSELYYSDNKLYILGGFNENNYSVYLSRGPYSIDINEFEKTKVNNFKTL